MLLAEPLDFIIFFNFILSVTQKNIAIRVKKLKLEWREDKTRKLTGV